MSPDRPLRGRWQAGQVSTSEKWAGVRKPSCKNRCREAGGAACRGLWRGPGSGGLVQGPEEVSSLQKRGAAWHRQVHLTVISGQFGQQVRFD